MPLASRLTLLGSSGTSAGVGTRSDGEFRPTVATTWRPESFYDKVPPMSSDSQEHDLGALSASLRAHVEYEQEMGQEEILVERGVELAPLEEESQAPAAEPSSSPDELMAGLEEELAGCTRCELSKGRQNIVFGVGSRTARLVFVGEGPGRDEDERGIPFVGAAGKLLTRIIKAIGLERDDVYICNVVKCRPPNNRVPEPEEQETCGPFLERQLEIISPEVIVTLGATAARYLLNTERSVGRLRGRFHPYGEVAIMATYPPGYLLPTPDAIRAVWEDMKKVRDRLGLPS